MACFPGIAQKSQFRPNSDPIPQPEVNLTNDSTLPQKADRSRSALGGHQCRGGKGEVHPAWASQHAALSSSRAEGGACETGSTPIHISRHRPRA